MKDDTQSFEDEKKKFVLAEEDQFEDTRIYPEASKPQLVLQCLCLLYPVYYETLKLLKTGCRPYWENNLQEAGHIIFGYVNVYF